MGKEIYITKSSMPPFDEYVKEIKSLWDTRWLTNMGEKHCALENRLKQYLSTDNLLLTVNGHMALELGLQALGIHGEVITTPFTFASTTHAIVRSGLKPIFCDINPQDYTIDVSKIERLITDKTVAILPVHVYGNICDTIGIKEIADKYGLKTIYDSAHAFGEKYEGIGIMNYGDISILSFHATKVFHTIEGGAICYREKKLGDIIQMMRDFGIENENSVVEIGTNAKMNEFCAAMGLCNLKHIDEEIEKRKKAVEYYMEHLEGLPGIILNKTNSKIKPNYAYFPVLINEKECGYSRDEICKQLSLNKIFPRKYFYPLTNDMNCYRKDYDCNDTPVAKQISNQIMTLPLYADIQKEEIIRVCKVFHMWKDKAI